MATWGQPVGNGRFECAENMLTAVHTSISFDGTRKVNPSQCQDPMVTGRLLNPEAYLHC